MCPFRFVDKGSVMNFTLGGSPNISISITNCMMICFSASEPVLCACSDDPMHCAHSLAHVTAWKQLGGGGEAG